MIFYSIFTKSNHWPRRVNRVNKIIKKILIYKKDLKFISKKNYYCNIILANDKFIKKLKPKLFHKGCFEYSFSHFNLETEIFFGNIKKAHLSNANWIKKSSYSKSGLPTVMKKIVEIAV